MIDGILASVGPYEIRISSSIITDVKGSHDKKGVIVYPNPSAGIVNIDFGIIEKKSTIRVVDLPGNLLKEEIVQNTSKAWVDISALSDGIYFLEVKNENGFITQKIILNR